MENGWQFSKVYRHYLDKNGEPTAGWWNWARSGWAAQRACRYPMGCNARPEYSYWNGEHLDYIEARHRIYIPLYAYLVAKTKAFAELQRRYAGGDEIVLWDYDGYDHTALGFSLDDVLADPRRKMGHAFVLAMLLTRRPFVSAWL